MKYEEISTNVSIMEHQLQDAIKMNNYPLIVAYIQQLRHYLDNIIEEDTPWN